MFSKLPLSENVSLKELFCFQSPCYITTSWICMTPPSLPITYHSLTAAVSTKLCCSVVECRILMFLWYFSSNMCLHLSLVSSSHFSPTLKCCHGDATLSSRLAGRGGRSMQGSLALKGKGTKTECSGQGCRTGV